MSYTHFTIEERCCLRKFYKKDIVIDFQGFCEIQKTPAISDKKRINSIDFSKTECYNWYIPITM